MEASKHSVLTFADPSTEHLLTRGSTATGIIPSVVLPYQGVPCEIRKEETLSRQLG
jgi:hypothetical protein